MATLRLWPFSLMARTVLGFVASSLNLASEHLHPDDTASEDKHPKKPGGTADREVRNERLRRRQLAARQPAPTFTEPWLDRETLGRDGGTLDIAGPPTWQRRHSSSTQVTEYLAPNLRAGVASFVVPPAVEFVGTAEGFEAGMLRRISQGMPIAEGSTRRGVVGGFRFVSCTMKPPWGAPRWVVLYTTLWGHKGQVVLFGADCEQLFGDHVLLAHTLVEKIEVPGRPAPALH